jgi:hypothetical protein
MRHDRQLQCMSYRPNTYFFPFVATFCGRPYPSSDDLKIAVRRRGRGMRRVNEHQVRLRKLNFFASGNPQRIDYCNEQRPPHRYHPAA